MRHRSAKALRKRMREQAWEIRKYKARLHAENDQLADYIGGTMGFGSFVLNWLVRRQNATRNTLILDELYRGAMDRGLLRLIAGKGFELTEMAHASEVSNSPAPDPASGSGNGSEASGEAEGSSQ